MPLIMKKNNEKELTYYVQKKENLALWRNIQKNLKKKKLKALNAQR